MEKRGKTTGNEGSHNINVTSTMELHGYSEIYKERKKKTVRYSYKENGSHVVFTRL